MFGICTAKASSSSATASSIGRARSEAGADVRGQRGAAAQLPRRASSPRPSSTRTNASTTRRERETMREFQPRGHGAEGFDAIMEEYHPEPTPWAPCSESRPRAPGHQRRRDRGAAVSDDNAFSITITTSVARARADAHRHACTAEPRRSTRGGCGNSWRRRGAGRAPSPRRPRVRSDGSRRRRSFSARRFRSRDGSSERRRSMVAARRTLSVVVEVPRTQPIAARALAPPRLRSVVLTVSRRARCGRRGAAGGGGAGGPETVRRFWVRETQAGIHVHHPAASPRPSFYSLVRLQHGQLLAGRCRSRSWRVVLRGTSPRPRPGTRPRGRRSRR